MVLHTTWMIMVNVLVLFPLVITNVIGTNGDKLLFSNKQDIRQFKFGDGNYTPVIGGLEYVRSLDYDFKENRLFFISLHNNEKTVIQSMNLLKKDEEPKVIVNTATQLENDLKTLAVDWLSKKIYFTDLLRKRVEVVDYDGLYRRVVVFTGLKQPDGLALFPQKGLMFVTDWGSTKKIERFNMDGSDRKIIYDDHVAWGRSITIDYLTSTIYWGDTRKNIMASMDINGLNLKYYNLAHSPTYITVSNSMVYWSDGKILSALLKTNPNNSTVSISQLKGTRISPNDIRVFTNYRQPEFPNPCAKNNGGCSHLCLLRVDGYTCACPTGVALKEDNKTCEDGMKKFLVVARRENIRLVSLDIDKSIDFRLKVARKYTRNVHGVAYDVERKRVYWADTGCTDKSVVNNIVDCSDPGSINSIFLNGTGFEQFVTHDIKAPDHIAVDWIARNIYWTDGVLSRIEVSRLDGSSRKIIISDYLHKPRGLTIDPADAKLYWSDWGNVSKIERSDLNGDNREVLVEKEAEWPNDIALDLQGRKLYWADARSTSISYYDLNSKEVRTLYDKAGHPFGITILGDYIYWTDWFRKVMRLKLKDMKVKHNNRDKEKVILDEIADVMGICAVDTSIKYGTNPCDYRKNNCTHLCFVKPNRGVATCDCPSGMELAKDDRTCQVPSGYLIYSVAKEILKSSIDTFKQSRRLPLSNTNRVSRFAVHYKTNRMVWLDEEGQREMSSINSGFINGSNFRIIMKVDSAEVESFAIDWMSQNVYIAMQKSNHIEVVRMDGLFRKVLIFRKDLLSPRCILVNPHLSKLYWAHKNDSTHALFQANLDGSEIKELFKVILHICAIDYKTNNIYCIVENDKLISYDPVRGVKSDVRSYLSGWMSMVIFQNNIIHTNIYTQTISKISTSPHDTSEPFNLLKVSDPMDFKIYHPEMQTGENLCSHNNGGCQHFCFALSKTMANCSCATHYTLGVDKKSCIEPDSFLIGNQNNNFVRIMSTNGVPVYILPVFDVKSVGPMAFDDVRDYIYWLRVSERVIYRAFQNGTGGHSSIQLLTDAQLRSDEKIEPCDIALDPFSNTLFWTDKAKNTINFLNMYTGARGIVFSKDGYFPRKIIAYPNGGKLFWTSVDERARRTLLLSITFAGTETHELKSLDRSVLDDLTIDHTSKLLYYLDTANNRIWSMSLKGLEKHEYRIDPKFSPVSIATNKDYIFWADHKTIYKRSKDDFSSGADMFFHGRFSDISEIISVNTTRKQRPHPCFGDNGGCSHICRISYEVSLSSEEKPQAAAICGCPLNFHLDSASSKNCTVAEMCGINEMFCKEDSRCIPVELKCDGKNDCSDGQDEIDPECIGLFPRPPCPKGYRRCGSTQKCVRLSEWCDGEQNCPNNEDEETCVPCKENQFACDGGCIDISLKCNGETDCHDLTDENDCSTPTLSTSVTVQEASTGQKKSRLLAAVVSGVIVCIICFMFAILFYFKFRNSKKNTANQAAGTSAWALQQLRSLSSSDDHTKSSLSTFISNDTSYYDRNNMTGQSDVCDSEFSQLIFNPPPSPVTERSMSTITAARNNTLYNDYETPRCDHCHRRLMGDDSSLVEGAGGGLDAPPPTVVSSTLVDDVDMYFPTDWSQKSTVCEDCQSTAASTQGGDVQAGRNINGGVSGRHVPRSNGHLRNINVNGIEPLNSRWMYANQDPNLDRQYGEEPLFIDSNGHLIDPPPSPCTYLSEEDRPPSPDFSEIHGCETHYAPPPSPTSQLL